MKTHMTLGCIALAVSLSACNASEIKNQPLQKAQAPAQVSAAKGVLSGSNKGQYMKPGAPVQLSYSSAKVGVGEISDILATLHLTSAGVDQVQVDINTDQDVVLHSSPGLSSQLDLVPGTLNYPIRLSASSSKVGLAYINLTVTTWQNGNKQSRALSIPLQTGSDEQIQALKKANSKVVLDANNTPVIPMEAVETIK